MARYKKKRALLTPDLTPLIDVVFLLLIFLTEIHLKVIAMYRK